MILKENSLFLLKNSADFQVKAGSKRIPTVSKALAFRFGFWLIIGSKRIPLEPVMSQKSALKGRAFQNDYSINRFQMSFLKPPFRTFSISF
jgi:hypothetical protein